MKPMVISIFSNELASERPDGGVEYKFRCTSCKGPIHLYVVDSFRVLRSQCPHCGDEYKIRVSPINWQVEKG